MNIGTDCIALDNSLDTQFSTHMPCKKCGIVNTESLANLGAAATGARGTSPGRSPPK